MVLAVDIRNVVANAVPTSNQTGLGSGPAWPGPHLGPAPQPRPGWGLGLATGLSGNKIANFLAKSK